jgi:5,10-methylenetetrahydromethanopterin reductase
VKNGIELVPYKTLDTLTSLAQLAERLGFEQVWVCDHWHNRYVHTVLAKLALATKEIKLGPGVTNPYLVHPSVTAAAIATLDEISKGRATLGISAGDPVFLATVGVNPTKPLTAVREATYLIKKLLAGETLNFEGKLFRCNGARLKNKCPHEIPVYMGGRRQRMLELAGEVADGALINASHPADIKECVKWVRGELRKAKSKKEFDMVAYMAVSIDRDEKKAKAAVKNVVSFIASSTPPEALERHEINPEVVKSIKHRLLRGDLHGARELVDERMIDAFAVCGRIEKLSKRIEELPGLGITRVVMGSPIGPDQPRAIGLISELFQK